MPGMKTEQLMPMLSAGRHRSPSKGACFMEFASYLAGERWSDHPRCTHPMVAALARLVNDLTSDTQRPSLTPFISSVVGLNGKDRRISLVVAILAAAHALPIASDSRQRVLAVGVLRCIGFLGREDHPVCRRALVCANEALETVPLAAAAAREFLHSCGPARPFTDLDEAILRTSALGIAEACVPDPDVRLRELLVQVIDEVSELLRPATSPRLTEAETETAAATADPATEPALSSR